MMRIAMALLLFLGASQDPILNWERFEKGVRDQVVGKEQAKKEFPGLYKALKTACSQYSFQDAPSWEFPVRGYGLRDVGAGGFRPDIRYGSSPVKGYDFYDGNRHGGHPAYDIFIRDRNFDSLDDKTGKPVAVIAPIDLLVLSTEDAWTPASLIRGGRYVWALDPLHDRLLYFAHLHTITVQAGDFLPARLSGPSAGPAGMPCRSDRLRIFI